MKMRKIEITPGPDLLYSLQRTGYKWYQAVLDIVDNSIDALREKHEETKKEDGFARINFVSSGGRCSCIVVADNGTGITPKSLEEILRMGTSLKRGGTALGTFGMGLKTAGMSLGNRITVISTVSKKSELRSVTWDITRATRLNRFEADFHEIPPLRHVEYFEEYVGDCPGTVVLIEDVREEGMPSYISSMKETFRKKCSHTYRHILNLDKDHLGTHFPVTVLIGMGKTSRLKKTNDPLLIRDERTEILIGGEDGSFEEYSYPPNSKNFKFKVRMIHSTATRHLKSKLGLELGANMGPRGQGVYWLRGGRELDSGSFWKPRQGLSNVYAEVSFEDEGLASKNGLIRMDFGKKGVVLTEDLEKYMLKHIFNPQLNKLEKKASAAIEKRKKPSRKELYKKVASVALPSDLFGRERQTTNSRAKAEASVFERIKAKSKKTRKNSKYRGTSIKCGKNEIDFEFKDVEWRGSDLPYDIEYTEGDPTLLILLNIEHKWIEKNILRNENQSSCQQALQVIATSTISHMYEDECMRRDIFVKMGHLLMIFDEDFGAFEGTSPKVKKVDNHSTENDTANPALKDTYQKFKQQQLATK